MSLTPLTALSAVPAPSRPAPSATTSVEFLRRVIGDKVDWSDVTNQIVAAIIIALFTAIAGAAMSWFVSRRKARKRWADALAFEARLPQRSDIHDAHGGRSTPSKLAQDALGKDPPYVVREVDEILDQLLAKAPSVVLLKGPSKAGKSRTGWEAALRAKANVVVPRDREGLAVLIESEYFAKLRRPFVLWLDDFERFVEGSPPALAFRHLRIFESSSERGRCTILGTIRTDEYERIKRDKEVNAILDASSVVELAAALNKAERSNLEPYVRLVPPGEARLGEALVAGQELLRQLDSHRATAPLAFAVVQAAIGWRSLGLNEPTPKDMLERLWLVYAVAQRPNVQPDRAGFEEALKVACIPPIALASVGYLQPTWTVDPPAFSVYDYVYERVARDPMPAAAIETLFEGCSAPQLLQIARNWRDPSDQPKAERALLLAGQKDPELKGRAQLWLATSLEAIDGPRSIALLKSLTRDPNPWVAQLSWAILGSSMVAEAAGVDQEMALRRAAAGKDPGVAYTARVALAGLIAEAKPEESVRLYRQALAACAESEVLGLELALLSPLAKLDSAQARSHVEKLIPRLAKQEQLDLAGHWLGRLKARQDPEAEFEVLTAQLREGASAPASVVAQLTGMRAELEQPGWDQDLEHLDTTARVLGLILVIFQDRAAAIRVLETAVAVLPLASGAKSRALQLVLYRQAGRETEAEALAAAIQRDRDEALGAMLGHLSAFMEQMAYGKLIQEILLESADPLPKLAPAIPCNTPPDALDAALAPYRNQFKQPLGFFGKRGKADSPIVFHNPEIHAKVAHRAAEQLLSLNREAAVAGFRRAVVLAKEPKDRLPSQVALAQATMQEERETSLQTLWSVVNTALPPLVHGPDPDAEVKQPEIDTVIARMARNELLKPITRAAFLLGSLVDPSDPESLASKLGAQAPLADVNAVRAYALGIGSRNDPSRDAKYEAWWDFEEMNESVLEEQLSSPERVLGACVLGLLLRAHEPDVAKFFLGLATQAAEPAIAACAQRALNPVPSDVPPVPDVAVSATRAT